MALPATAVRCVLDSTTAPAAAPAMLLPGHLLPLGSQHHHQVCLLVTVQDGMHLPYALVVLDVLCYTSMRQSEGTCCCGGTWADLIMPQLLFPVWCPGQDGSAGKLSAAAFISRAHAAALAASAQQRGQRTVSGNSTGAYGSPGFSSFGSPSAANSFAGEHYASSPGQATSLAAAVAAGGSGADLDMSAAAWQVKRPRVSSSGIPEAAGGQPLLEHFGSVPAMLQQQQQDGSLSSFGGKISASEQLRLTHSALRASATGGGGGGMGQQLGGGSLSTSNSNSLGPFGRISSASGGPSADGGGGQLLGPGGQQAMGSGKRRVSNHRRFASMGAMQ